MNGQHTHSAKWIALLLTGMGSLAVALGVFVAVFTVTRAPAVHQGIRMPGIVYIGANTCYTCHKGQPPHNWSQLIYAQEVTHPLANPQQATTLEVTLKTDTDPLVIGQVASDGVAQHADWLDSQHYVVATEESSVIAPSHLSTPDCSDCDAAPRVSKNLRPSALSEACTICHWRRGTVQVRYFPNSGAQYG